MAERFKEKKIKLGDNDYEPSKSGFTETKKFKVLHCGNVEGNNNKFYCLELQHNPTSGEYRLFSHYGRLGLSEVFGLRDFDYIDNCRITDMSVLDVEFDSIIKKKLKGKTIKDDRGLGESRRENYEEVRTFSPKVGSPNIRDKSVTITTTKVAAVDISNITNQRIVKLINQIVDENIHNITSLTSLTLTSNGFETPLGPVTKEQVDEARAALDILKSLIKDDKINSEKQDTRTANNKYYSLIPHQFSHKITIDDWILDSQKLINEYDLLDQLTSAVQMGSALNQNASQRLNALGVDIDELSKSDNDFDRLQSYVHNSRAGNHRGLDVWGWRVYNIFKVLIPDERKRFETTKVKLGNIKELFHGSKNCNILSILKNGLIIPPYNAGHVTGRLFGNGIYAAHHSTKSLNYSTGWWSGSKNRYDNAFLFIVNFTMGNAYVTHNTASGGPPKGYNSLWAKSGSGSSLYNDEYIVYTPSQATITHLIEMKK